MHACAGSYRQGMDAWSVAVSIAASLVGGGLVGGLVALRVARRESDDRKAALALEREKWEHEKSATSRDRARKALDDALALLAEANDVVGNLSDHAGMLEDRAGTDDPETREVVRTAYWGIGDLTRRWPAAMSALSGTGQPYALAAFVPVIGEAGQYVLSVLQGNYDASPSAFGASHIKASHELHQAADAL